MRNTVGPADSSEVEKLYQRATAEISNGRIAEAMALLRKVLVLEPYHVDALNDLGALNHDCGEYGAALSCLAAAYALDPKRGFVGDNLRGLLEKIKQTR